MPLTLVIGNKNYSSWSMRPWLALAHHKIPFEEIIIPLGQSDSKSRMLQHSPAGKVPILIDGDVTVWESLAILEHLNERFPEAQLWPAESKARARARAVATEMHGGFAALRRDCPMSLKRRRGRTISPEAIADLRRITEIWRNAHEQYGKSGDYLFGAFTAVDCMYAPVATRIVSYELQVDPVARAYVDAIYRLPAFAAWRDAGLAEKWDYPSTDTVD